MIFDSRRARMRRRLRRLGCVAGASLCLLATGASAESAPAQLWLTPRSCMLAAGESDGPCVERIRIRWSAPDVPAVCIWQHGSEQPVFCESRPEGERELVLPIPASTQFDLTAQLDGPVLASIELLVMTGAENGKRRRYQHPWSIF